MADTANPQMIIVASHRGGSGKSLLSVLLATALASLDISVMVVDYSLGAGAASLDNPSISRDGKPWTNVTERPAPYKHTKRPLRILHAPGMMQQDDVQESLIRFSAEQGIDIVIHDTPAGGGHELAPILRHASLALLVVPCEANSFRTLLPFMEYIQGERSRPRRDFHTRAVLVEPHEGGFEQKQLREQLESYLAAILLKPVLPHDPRLGNQVADGLYPMELGEEMSKSLRKMTMSMLDILKFEVAGTLHS
ncbi:MAG: ParA family protein [Candidatus Sumerlaeia bacterium]|nr:ParA family protein [Candidatus Sumerlaeia bacterium]